MSKRDSDGRSEHIHLTTQLQHSLRQLLSRTKQDHQYHSQQPIATESTRHDPLKQLSNLRREREQLLSDNEYLSREVMRSREEVRMLQKEVEKYREKTRALESSLDQLKQQLVYWTRKPLPVKKIESQDNANVDYKQMLDKIQALKRSNRQKQEHLKRIGIQKQATEIEQVSRPRKIQIKTDSILTPKSARTVVKTPKKGRRDCTSCYFSKQYTDRPPATPRKTSIKSSPKSPRLCNCHFRFRTAPSCHL